MAISIPLESEPEIARAMGLYNAYFNLLESTLFRMFAHIIGGNWQLLSSVFYDLPARRRREIVSQLMEHLQDTELRDEIREFLSKRYKRAAKKRNKISHSFYAAGDKQGRVHQIEPRSFGSAKWTISDMNRWVVEIRQTAYEAQMLMLRLSALPPIPLQRSL